MILMRLPWTKLEAILTNIRSLIPSRPAWGYNFQAKESDGISSWFLGDCLLILLNSDSGRVANTQRLSNKMVDSPCCYSRDKNFVGRVEILSLRQFVIHVV